MKVKIIKRAELKKNAAVTSPAVQIRSKDGMTTAATVKSWIRDLTQKKREDELLLFNRLFGENHCS